MLPRLSLRYVDFPLLDELTELFKLDFALLVLIKHSEYLSRLLFGYLAAQLGNTFKEFAFGNIPTLIFVE